MFRSEIDLAIKLLGKENVEMLPADQWNSAVNSGALKLFNILELESLTNIYNHINRYNNQYHIVGYNYDFVPDEIKQDIASLENDLIKLKNAEWFNPDAKKKGWWKFWK
jgi:hypothetical protein